LLRDGRRPRILVVDDEPVATRLLEKLLGDEYDVVSAATGADGLARMAEREADLVIADHRMPGMTGVEFLAEARRRWPDCIRIVLTAYSDPDAMLDAINRGEAYRFVFKPWNPVDMRTTLREALERRALERENRRLVEDLRHRNDDLNRSLAQLEEARNRLLAAEKLALAGRLATGLAHDLRNYLTAVANLHLFSEGYDENEELREMIDFVGQATQDMKSIVAEFGAIARGDVPRYDLVPGDLGQAVREAVRVVRHGPAFKRRPVELDCGPVPLVPMALDRLRRVILNLLHNAADAGPEGRPIRVRVFAPPDGGAACVDVTDEGPGIPAAIRERIWEPFFTTKEAGTGLGLDICKVIVAGHRGRIDVESVPGCTRFSVLLPA
jgi:signal transduction histidine kinase